MRLNSYIASCGLCSRRDADKMIQDGLVTVNGTPATPGMRVTGKEEITVQGKRLGSKDKKVVVAWYKPVGVTCTERDPYAERTIKEAFSYPVRLTYAGRLDRDSEGLMLMTNDGKLIEYMMRGSNGHEKEYIVRVRGRISDASLQRLRKGIYLRELETTTRPCEVTRLGDHTFRIVLTQGLNQQIRRMCKAVGNEVKTLKRVRVLTVRLNDLQPGQSREIKGRREMHSITQQDSEQKRMKELVGILQRAAKAYYAEDTEIMSNLEYDRLYDELCELEKKTGVILAGSPTQQVGYASVDTLPKERHEKPMLSLGKTKSREELQSWLGDQEVFVLETGRPDGGSDLRGRDTAEGCHQRQRRDR